MPDPVNGLFQMLETYDSPLEMDALAATFGVTPTSLDDFVHAFVSTARGTGPVATE
jgi:hypothetical protein